VITGIAVGITMRVVGAARRVGVAVGRGVDVERATVATGCGPVAVCVARRASCDASATRVALNTPASSSTTRAPSPPHAMSEETITNATDSDATRHRPVATFPTLALKSLA
jgi:hypothetical protein